MSEKQITDAAWARYGSPDILRESTERTFRRMGLMIFATEEWQSSHDRVCALEDALREVMIECDHALLLNSRNTSTWFESVRKIQDKARAALAKARGERG